MIHQIVLLRARTHQQADQYHIMAASKVVETLTQPPAEKKKKSKKVKEGKSKDSVEKSSKKKRKTTETAAAVISDEQPKKKKKKSKTDTVHSSSDSEDTTVAGAAPAAAVVAPAVAAAAPAEPANPLALDNFRLSAPIKSLLRAKNMDTLYDIQAQTLNFCLDGFDLVGRARTGTGKTLAFVLPIIERLSQGYDGSKRAYGRGPRVIVLAPTRELAKQVNFQPSLPAILQQHTDLPSIVHFCHPSASTVAVFPRPETKHLC